LNQAPEPAAADSVLLEAIEKFVGACGGSWRGTATALLEEIADHVRPHQRKAPGWPRSAMALGRAIRRIQAQLKRQRGIEVTCERSSDKDRTRLIAIRKLSEPSEPAADGESHEPGKTCAADGSGANKPGPTPTVRRSHGNGRTVDPDHTTPEEELSETLPSPDVVLETILDGSDSSDSSPVSGAPYTHTEMRKGHQ
jgi:hypothetical protein